MNEGFYDSTLSTEPNTIVKLLTEGSTSVLKIYKRQSEQLLRILELKMVQRYRIGCWISGQSVIPLKISVTLNKDGQDHPYLRIVAPYMPICHLPIHMTNQLKVVLLPLLNQLIKNDNCFLYSHDNIFYNQASINLVNFNITSNTGLPFLLTSSSIPKKQFTQIYQLIDPELFKLDFDQRISFKLKFRALGMVIISFILNKKVSLIFQSDQLSEVISFKEAISLLQKSLQRFKQLLSNPYFRAKIEAAEVADSANYLYFLKRTFIDNCKDLTWSEAAQLLIFQRKSIGKKEVFTEIAEKMFRHERPENRHLYQSLGLGHQQDRQLYLLVKSLINLESILRYATLQDYLEDEGNWNLQKQQNCKKLMNVLTSNPSPSHNIERQFVEDHPLQQYIVSKFNNPYEQFKDAYELIKKSMESKSLRVQNKLINYMTNQEKIIRQYLRL